jgi:hypothetical protein
MTERETTSIELKIGTWRSLMRLKEEPGDSFDDVVQRLIRAYESGGRDTGDTIKEAEDVPGSAARHANQGGTPPSSSPTAPAQHAILESVVASWDRDGRHEDRRAAADAALSLLLSRGQLSKSEALDELLPEHAVEGQSPETWWRKNVRPVLQEAATYSKGVNAYVLDEPSQQ